MVRSAFFWGTFLILVLGGCNYSLTSVARGDEDIYRVHRPIRLTPTCLSVEPKGVEKVELIEVETQETTVLNPTFNEDGLFWTPGDNLSGRYRFRFTCDGKWCYSPAFVVDGALDKLGQPIHHPQEEASSFR